MQVVSAYRQPVSGLDYGSRAYVMAPPPSPYHATPGHAALHQPAGDQVATVVQKHTVCAIKRDSAFMIITAEKHVRFLYFCSAVSSEESFLHKHEKYAPTSPE